ncbi:Rho-type GTPase-activating protein 1 [Golovinomyces cichoracearum]|uniref:Rho-type GTPase-activating protein 1 n=1 Tax=Golovinomyces cichoracearum TaxID=62708 RepID=A0A420HA62_9PEZI|nr:Rho-type GTPase-activating protein 1 [Golovinomyces cichoracearum]
MTSPFSERERYDNHSRGSNHVEEKYLHLDGDLATGAHNEQSHVGEETPFLSEKYQENALLKPRLNSGTPSSEKLNISPPRSARGRQRNSSLPINSGEKNTSRSRNARTPSRNLRLCEKCCETLTGQFVRALGGTYHLDCFRCRDCGQIVASKFFPIDEENGEGQYPLCETDYFKRLDLICHKCNTALRGSYITALDRKYHIDHFTCSVCPTVFGAQDSYYEHNGQVYCHYHYSTQFAQRCNGCYTAILKQFVEIFRNGQNQHWHPECYMIHKFWNVRLAPDLPQIVKEGNQNISEGNTDEKGRDNIKQEEEIMEEKVYKIWSVLSTFEESSAACISDMLLHVSNGAYVEGVLVAKKFIWHVDVLFHSADKLDATMEKFGPKGLSYSRETKLLCKKIVAFFSLLSKTQETGVRKLGVTQELLALVTGLAHYLKLLIRICLQGALRVERDQNNPTSLHDFLDDLSSMDAPKSKDLSLEVITGTPGPVTSISESCFSCKKEIEEECCRCQERRCHFSCLECSTCHRDLQHCIEYARLDQRDQRIYCSNCQENELSHVIGGFERVTRLQQYVFLLRVALARLLPILQKSGNLPHTSDDPNLNGYNSSEGHRLPQNSGSPLLRSDTRSKSYGSSGSQFRASSSYENTLNDVRRLRSTRMDQRLSSAMMKSKTSRVMNPPEGKVVGDSSADSSIPNNTSSKLNKDSDVKGISRTELMFGHQDALTLDDIPRIVAAEQAKEHRPNAYKHARHDLFRTSVTEPKLINGYQRTFQNANGPHQKISGESSIYRRDSCKRYFSELSALEYFIVRHVAVIAMQPILDGYFTMEELLNLIETRKPTFWNKMGKAFKNDGKKGGKKKGVFGVPLEIIIERDGADSTDGIGPGALRIPAIVDDAVRTMRKMDLSVEGVFRKNGNIKRLNETSSIIDKDGCDAVDFSKENVVQVAALLKKYLRDLPDPLLTFKLHRLFITSQKIADEEKRRRVLHLTCCLLPKAHRDCLEILCSFFNWVASFHQVDEESGSKMDTHNLATVIAPNILLTNAKTPVDDNFLAIEVVHTLIECNEQMCEIPEDLQSILSDQTLFNNTSDITTKEILKRFGDLSVNCPHKQNLDPETSALGNQRESSRAFAPIVTRVDSDPSQAHAWHKETSVRHIQEPNAIYQSSLSHSSPSQQDWPVDKLSHSSPFINRTGTPDSQNGNLRGDYNNSEWERTQNGSVRVAGAG